MPLSQKQQVSIVLLTLVFALALAFVILKMTKLRTPSEQAAKQAVIQLSYMGKDDDFARENMVVKLGSCIAVAQPQHPGQIVCNVGVTIGGGFSGSQLEFYPSGDAWIAQHSFAPNTLPFPDPTWH